MQPPSTVLPKILERASIFAVLGYVVCGMYAVLVSTTGLLIPITVGLMFVMYCFLVLAGLIRSTLGITQTPPEEQTLTLVQLRAMLDSAPKLYRVAGVLGMGLVVFALLRFGVVTLTTHETPTLHQTIGALIYLSGLQLISLPFFSSARQKLENSC